jgi:hypothetical protein
MSENYRNHNNHDDMMCQIQAQAQSQDQSWDQ